MHVWIFAYGSLIWRPGFAHRERHVAYIDGFERRLEQGSPDHRGTPDRLGRVATLVRAEGARCGGVVYAIPVDESEAILTALDAREQGGYARIEVTATLAPPEEGTVRAVTWVATSENPYHLGPASLDEMAAQIHGAVGPSGTNIEYVLRLAEALLEHRIEDAHILELSAALRSRSGGPSG